MNSQLVLKSKVDPKPARGEIIDALTQLEVQKRNGEILAQVERRNELEKKIRAEIIKRFSAKDDPDPFVNLGYVREKATIYGLSIQFDVTPTADLTKWLIEYHSLPSHAYEVKFSCVRKEISRAASGIADGKRVSRLLEDEDSRKSLTALLDQITK